MIKKLIENFLPAVIFLSVLAVLFFIAPIGSNNITGFLTADSISINVSDSIESNTLLSGSIDLLLSESIPASSVLTVNFNNFIYEKPIKEILEQLSILYEETGEIITPINAKSSITLIYPSSGQQQTALKLPSGSTLDSIEMDIAGAQQSSQYPLFPYMDVDNDGLPEWQYFGSLLGFLPQNITPAGLSLTGTESITKIKDSTSNYYFCEVVNLPYSKDFLVHAKYSLYDAARTSGDLKAAILTLRNDQGTYYASGGGNNCDLPETASSAWKSCQVHFDNPIEGTSVICVYNSNAGNSDVDFYKISNDQSVKSTALVCDQPISGESQCTTITSNDDFYILASPANYSKRLSSSTKFSDGFTQYPIELALNSYLESCYSDDCAVPIKIYSNSPGQIKLSNLKVSYTINSLSKEESNFYDVQYSPSKINSIDNTDLSGYILSVPLELFNLQSPTPVLDSEIHNLVVSLDSISATKAINVTKVFDIASISDAEKAKALSERLQNINSKESELLRIAGLDLSSSISELNDFQSQIDLIVQSDKTPSQKELEIANILSSMESSLTDVPVSVKPIESISDIFAAEPDDVTEEVLLENQNKLDLYNFQEEVSVKVSATAYELEKYSGVKETKTLIKKTVSASIPNAYIFEIIPKSIASDVNQITFSLTPEVVNADPIVRWFYPSLSQESLTYLVNGNAMPYINNIKTLVVPENIPVKQKAVCGDNVCSYVTVDGERRYIETAETCPVDCKSKIPWGLIIFLTLLGIIGVYYINYYRGKYAFKEITGGLFNSKTDYNNLLKYIEVSQKQGLSKDKIEAKLAEKGWEKQQIAYVFRHLSKAVVKEKTNILEAVKKLFKRK